MKLSTLRQRQKVQTTRSHVLANASRYHRKALEDELIKEFGVNQMDLTQIGLRRIAGDAGAMFDGSSAMDIASNTDTLYEKDLLRRSLREAVRRTPVDR